jgi:flagellar basal-body rod modification protein FlgD
MTVTVTPSTSSAVAPASASAAASAADQSDRFLKLLVTQMQNQDPLNPMDNAQVTTQMAQISTVSGIDKLGTSIGALTTLLQQTQSLQAAALVGRNVQVAGQDLVPDDSGKASAGYDLAGPADSVVVTVTDASGQVVDTLSLGPQGAGRHSFDWQSKGGSGLSFSVSAQAGSSPVSVTPLVSDRVSAVYADGGQLSIQTDHHGVVAYADVKAVS